MSKPLSGPLSGRNRRRRRHCYVGTAFALGIGVLVAGCGEADPGAGYILEDETARELCVGEVDVPDAALRTLLEELLPQPAPPEGAEEEPPPVVLAQELRRLTGLRAPNLGIEDLTGLECALGLQSLGLAGNNVTDLGPIANITGIIEIDLARNGFTDLDGLPALERLEKVTLDENGISDIGPLARLPGLRFIDLADNEIRDIGPLASLKELTVLVLSSNQITDVDALAGLEELVALKLDRNAIETIEPLENLTKLRYVDLDANAIGSLEPLSKSDGLIELEVSGNMLTDLKGMSGKAELLEITANENMIETTSGVEGLTALATLELGSNVVSSLPGVETLVSLRKLQLANNQVTDISTAQGLPELRDLDLRENPGLAVITAVATMPLLGRLSLGAAGQSVDLSPLAGREVLRTLNYVNAGATSLVVLDALPALEVLDLSGTPISAQNVAEIGAVNRLQSLTMDNTGVADLSPLASNTLMEGLRARSNGVARIDVAANWPRVVEIDLQGNPVVDLAGVEALEILRVLNVSGSLIENVDPLAQNETFRRGDEVIAEGTPLGPDDCGAIAAIRARSGVVSVEFTCP